MSERQKLDIGGKGSNRQGKVRAEAGKNQTKSLTWGWPREGQRLWLLKDQLKELDR